MHLHQILITGKYGIMDNSSEDSYIICIFNYRKTSKINLWLKFCYISLCVCMGCRKGLYE